MGLNLFISKISMSRKKIQHDISKTRYIITKRNIVNKLSMKCLKSNKESCRVNCCCWTFLLSVFFKIQWIELHTVARFQTVDIRNPLNGPNTNKSHYYCYCLLQGENGKQVFFVTFVVCSGVRDYSLSLLLVLLYIRYCIWKRSYVPYSTWYLYMVLVGWCVYARQVSTVRTWYLVPGTCAALLVLYTIRYYCTGAEQILYFCETKFCVLCSWLYGTHTV